MKSRNLMLAALTFGALTAGLISSSRPVSAISRDQTAYRSENAVSVAAVERTTVPFMGAFQGSDTTIPPNIMETAGTGVATHLGRFSLIQRAELNFADLTDVGTAQWVGANGDSIETYLTGGAIFNDAGDRAIITEDHTITGGTGRFEGAEGSFTVVRTHMFALSADGTHVTFGSFEGTITSPGAAE